MSSSPKRNGASTTKANDESTSGRTSYIPEDISRIAAVLSETNLGAEETEELSESNLAALFKQIEGADGVLDGVEDKLDGLLGNLDILLDALESRTGDQETKKTDVPEASSAALEGDALSESAATPGNDGKLDRW